MPLLDASIAFFIWMMVLCTIVKSINTGLKSLPFGVKHLLSKAISDALARTQLKPAHIGLGSESDKQGTMPPQFAKSHPEEFLAYLEKYRLQVVDQAEIVGKIDQVLSMSRGRIRRRMLLISFLVSITFCFFLDINAFAIGSRLFANSGPAGNLWHIHDGGWAAWMEQFLTACMISVGAPYWHDMLEKFISFKKELNK